MTPSFITGGLPARHGFLTRQGGQSTGAYASLNCSLSGADAPADVAGNRASVALTMGVAPDRLLGCKQVHGVTVKTVFQPWVIGTGPEADAIVTAAPNLALSVITADCAPVLFSDDEGRVVGAAHAGWRGALAGVLEATAAAMRAIGASAITAAVGPCIHQASYEVRADLRGPILDRDPADARFFEGGASGCWYFDLPGYCAARLAADGVAVEILPHDTCADEARFFSHRRRTLRAEKALGHQISAIRL